MSFVLTPYVLVFAVTALIATLAAGIAWARRLTPGAPTLALVMVAVTLWVSAAGLEAAAVPVQDKVFWSKVEYLGGNATVLFWLVFILQYTGHEQWLNRRRLALLSTVPVFNVVVAVTNDWHRLLWTEFTPGPVGTNLIIYHHGPLYAVVAAATLILTMAGTLLMVRTAMRQTALHRRQAGIVLAASVVPWIASLLYSLELTPFPGLDLVPGSFVVSGGILLWGLLRTQILDLVPVAREAIIERMSDGVLVVDAQDRIVDLNPAAMDLLGVTSSSIGQPAPGLLEKWPAILASCHDADGCQSEITLDAGASRFADLRVSPLRDRRGRVTGRLLVIRDISRRKEAEAAVQLANQRLQEQLAEINELHAKLREEAIRDVLTTLFNRRYLDETLPRELSRAARERFPLSLVMLDVDDFKQLNDKYGHEAGDTILKAIGPFLRAQIRAGDIACRFGGEEFVVVMPNTLAETACQRAESWRAWFGQLITTFHQLPLQGTLSVGISAFPEHGQTAAELLRAADMALYAAKSTGRNRVVTWHAGLTAKAPHTGLG
jgi:diguanylate cyclase (GGDEF)-like protein/PAS domain S-box-containing protein